MKNQIKLTLWKDGKTAERTLDVPTFVIDEKIDEFKTDCQNFYYSVRLYLLQNKVEKSLDSLEKILKEKGLLFSEIKELSSDDFSKLPDVITNSFFNYAEAKNDLDNFEGYISKLFPHCIIPRTEDKIAKAYTWAMLNLSIELPMTGLKALRTNTISYSEKFYGSEAWDKYRKDSFGEIRASINCVLDTIFDTRENSTGRYKKMSTSVSAKVAEETISRFAGTLKTTKEGGIKKARLTESECGKQLILAFLLTKGCDSIKMKKSKAEVKTAWDL